MLGQQPEQMFKRRTAVEAPHSDLHNVAPHEAFPEGSTMAPSPRSELSAGTSTDRLAGTWGEHDVGGPVDQQGAMTNFDELRKELTKLSLQRSKSVASTARRRSRFARTQTSSTSRKATERDGQRQASVDSSIADLEAGQGSTANDDDEFALDEFLKNGHFEKRTSRGESAKKVGVVFQHLTVKGVGASMVFTKTLPDAILGTFGPDLYHLVCRFIPTLRFGKPPPTRDLIRDFTGFVQDGEMMLVLGRPGSGCSTFLKAIANERESFAAVEGEVSYGGISAEVQRKSYKGEVSYNPEDDVHMPALTVWQTLQFALMNKTRKHEAGGIPIIIDALLKIFGISHTKDTFVGNEYVRGVSGGERKRVGIAETLATKSSVVCWDNSTRGLDASTALDYAKSLRIMTDISNRTTLVTLYQAGEGIYQQMDKVLVIEEGRMIYQGPANAAKQYFQDLGFHCPDRQTTADFLTSIGDPNERRFKPDMEASAPKTAQELEEAYRRSDMYKQILEETEAYRKSLQQTENSDQAQFRAAVQEQKSNSHLIPDQSSHTVSFWRQVLACTLREFWLFWGDQTTLWTKFFIIVSTGLIVGSLFYDESLDTSGAFSRGGALFFSILFLGWLQLTELMSAVSGRVIIARHASYSFYRPSAVVIARVLLDLPVLAFQSVLFSIILYFMAELDVDAGKFFIFLLIVYTISISITAMYRMFAALSPTIDDAVRFAGLALNLLIIYVGYVIPQQTLIGDVPWFGWLYYVNPISYAYEAVMTNEFANRVMECSPSQLVPRGPGIDPQYQTCSLAGAATDNASVPGSSYLQISFDYRRSHLWRNFGIVIALTVFYITVTAWASETFSFTSGGGGALVFKKSKKAKKMVKLESMQGDVEKAGEKGETGASLSSNTLSNETGNAVQDLARTKSVFTWENVSYEVPVQGGTKRLLNNVNGYVKPGSMIALMGASGAGKTTLLNTLSQRQKAGVVSGDMLVDGAGLGIDFQRGTGFCEQMDLHDQSATIREALEFSAILRQDRDIPKQEKLDYVNKIIELLELQDIEDALIMSLGVEQRKRLTIGVELAAKPDLLLFLDEPTSGLDSQSAFSIIRFLKKLSQAGQAIICTIHQPSSMLVQQFDMVLALNPGGNPFYFGPVGENGSAIIKYFADRGTQCPPDKNIAEFLLETAAKGGSRGPDGKRRNWNKEWCQSAENESMLKEIANIKEERSNAVRNDDKNKRPAREFAAPVTLQTYMVTKRTFVSYWRDPSYLYGKLFTAVLIGIFNGFTFYNLDDSLASLQFRLFTLFIIFVIPPTVVNGVVPKFFMSRSLWELREYPSKIYNWFAFCTAQVVAEIPMAIVSSVVYWLLWYYPTGLPRDTSVAGYVFLMTMLFFLFMASWGQWICAFAPSFTVISNVLPFFFVIFALMNGIIRPYSQLTVFWRYWLYYLNPSTWWINGLMSAVLGDLTVECKPGEATTFNIPPGQTCLSYAGSFVQTTGAGYLTNPSGTGQCGYCPYRTGAEYLSTINVTPYERWRDFGIFLGFVISNWLLVYFFIYVVRVKGFSFGLGWLFSTLGDMVSIVKSSIKNMFHRKKEIEEDKA